MEIGIARMDPTNGIVLPPPAVRISSGATTANAFQVICNAAVQPSAMTHPTKPLAMVSKPLIITS